MKETPPPKSKKKKKNKQTKCKPVDSAPMFFPFVSGCIFQIGQCPLCCARQSSTQVSSRGLFNKNSHYQIKDEQPLQQPKATTARKKRQGMEEGRAVALRHMKRHEEGSGRRISLHRNWRSAKTTGWGRRRRPHCQWAWQSWRGGRVWRPIDICRCRW